MAPLPETDVMRVQRWCSQRVPEDARDRLRVEAEVSPLHVTIVERRPPWEPGLGPEWTSYPVARLRYTRSTELWSIYWRDANQRFHEYDLVPPSANVDDLLTEIERDPTAIFWG